MREGYVEKTFQIWERDYKEKVLRAQKYFDLARQAIEKIKLIQFPVNDGSVNLNLAISELTAFRKKQEDIIKTEIAHAYWNSDWENSDAVL